jgi:catalase-peroxidase
MMSTADLALKVDPAYRAISERWRNDQAGLDDAFARAWFKLCHRDMGPKSRYLGPEVPAEDLIWQDPIPARDPPWSTSTMSRSSRPRSWLRPVHVRAGDDGLGLGSTFRGSDRRGGANGSAYPARAAEELGRQRAGAAGAGAGPAGADQGGVRRRGSGGKKVSIADLIVLGARLRWRRRRRTAAPRRGPFAPGPYGRHARANRPENMAVLEPKADAFRNYLQVPFSVPYRRADDRQRLAPAADRAGDDGADRRAASAGRQPRRLQAWRVHRPRGRAHQRLLPQPARHGPRPGRRSSGTCSWAPTGTRTSAAGPPRGPTWSTAPIRSCARWRRSTPPTTRPGSSWQDFVAAWTKVMNADRFDLKAVRIEDQAGVD